MRLIAIAAICMSSVVGSSFADQLEDTRTGTSTTIRTAQTAAALTTEAQCTIFEIAVGRNFTTEGDLLETALSYSVRGFCNETIPTQGSGPHPQ